MSSKTTDQLEVFAANDLPVVRAALDGYEAHQNPNGTWTILDVPFFSAHTDERGAEPETYDAGWLTDAVKLAQAREQGDGYLAPLHIQHHKPGSNDVQFAGKIRLRDVKALLYEGRPTPTIFGDLVEVPDDVYQEIKQGALPYRSVEIHGPDRPEILSLALLDHEVPYFRYSVMQIGREKKLRRRQRQQRQLVCFRATGVNDEGQRTQSVTFAFPEAERAFAEASLGSRAEALLREQRVDPRAIVKFGRVGNFYLFWDRSGAWGLVTINASSGEWAQDDRYQGEISFSSLPREIKDVLMGKAKHPAKRSYANLNRELDPMVAKVADLLGYEFKFDDGTDRWVLVRRGQIVEILGKAFQQATAKRKAEQAIQRAAKQFGKPFLPDELQPILDRQFALPSRPGRAYADACAICGKKDDGTWIAPGACDECREQQQQQDMHGNPLPYALPDPNETPEGRAGWEQWVRRDTDQGVAGLAMEMLNPNTSWPKAAIQAAVRELQRRGLPTDFRSVEKLSKGQRSAGQPGRTYAKRDATSALPKELQELGVKLVFMDKAGGLGKPNTWAWFLQGLGGGAVRVSPIEELTKDPGLPPNQSVIRQAIRSAKNRLPASVSGRLPFSSNVNPKQMREFALQLRQFGEVAGVALSRLQQRLSQRSATVTRRKDS